MTGKVSTVFISDIHLGNRRVKMEDMIKGLHSNLTPELLTSTDILFFVGDVFDEALELPAQEVLMILLFMRDILRLARVCNCKVRILEGTPSHDRRQSKYFEVVNEILHASERADLRYYDTLCIAREEDLGIDILYVPDEWRHDNGQTWLEVKALLKVHGLEKVDYSIMHGMFKYQVPDNLKLNVHIEANYLSITTRYISIGHVHTMSTFERILAQGSHGRLKQNEEEAKGLYHVVSYLKGGVDKIKFIENKLATPFKTIDVTDCTPETAAVEIDKVVQYYLKRTNLPIPFLRVKLNSELSKGIYSSFVKDYPLFNWDFLKVTDKEKDNLSTNRKIRKIAIPAININTIRGLLIEKLKTSRKLTGNLDFNEETIITTLEKYLE